LEAVECLPQPLQTEIADELQFDEIRAELLKYSLINIENNRIFMHRLLQEVVRDTLKNEWETRIDYCTKILYKFINPDFSTANHRNNFIEMIHHIILITEISASETTEIASPSLFLGYGFTELDNYSAALKWNIKASVIFEKELGKKHPDTAVTYSGIAIVYYCQGNYSEALKWNEKALVIVEKQLGEEHSKTITTYNNIASVYSHQGNYSAALKWYKKTLAVREKVLGKEHSNTVTTYNNIARVYFKQGNYSEALKLFLKSYKIFLSILGSAHPTITTMKNDMKQVYNVTNNTTPFEEWLQQAIKE
jgi:pentatricopeptide repeat protein